MTLDVMGDFCYEVEAGVRDRVRHDHEVASLMLLSTA